MICYFVQSARCPVAHRGQVTNNISSLTTSLTASERTVAWTNWRTDYWPLSSRTQRCFIDAAGTIDEWAHGFRHNIANYTDTQRILNCTGNIVSNKPIALQCGRLHTETQLNILWWTLITLTLATSDLPWRFTQTTSSEEQHHATLLKLSINHSLKCRIIGSELYSHAPLSVVCLPIIVTTWDGGQFET